MIRNDTLNHLDPTNTMSSKIRIVKICEYCQKEFIAKKTTTKCCSYNCNHNKYSDFHPQKHRFILSLPILLKAFFNFSKDY